MVLLLIELTEDEKQEGSHIPVEIFVVEVELRQVAEILAINRILESIDLKHSNFVLFVPIDFVTWWVE